MKIHSVLPIVALIALLLSGDFACAVEMQGMWRRLGSSEDFAARSAIVLGPDSYTQFTLDESLMRAALPDSSPRRSFSALENQGATSVAVPLPSGENHRASG
jgi:hypothetical protein